MTDTSTAQRLAELEAEVRELRRSNAILRSASALFTAELDRHTVDRGAHPAEFGVEPICTQLQAAPSTYYAAKARPLSPRSVSDAATTRVITKVHADNYVVYGARKVHVAPLRMDYLVARSRG